VLTGGGGGGGGAGVLLVMLMLPPLPGEEISSAPHAASTATEAAKNRRLRD
jgi:hypothetical protein